MPYLPISGFVGEKPKRRRRRIGRGITTRESLFAVRPFGKKRPFPWKNGKKTAWDKLTDTTIEFMLRPFVLEAEYAPAFKPSKKQIREAKQKQKLATAPKQFEFLWRRSKLAKTLAFGLGTTGFIFAPNPILGALGGTIAGFGIYSVSPYGKRTMKQYQALLKKRYGVPKRGFWKY